MYVLCCYLTSPSQAIHQSVIAAVETKRTTNSTVIELEMGMQLIGNQPVVGCMPS